MGAIVATYIVKVTLREPDDAQEGEVTPAPPTNAELEDLITFGIQDAEALGRLTVNARSERTDR